MKKLNIKSIQKYDDGNIRDHLFEQIKHYNLLWKCQSKTVLCNYWESMCNILKYRDNFKKKKREIPVKFRLSFKLAKHRQSSQISTDQLITILLLYIKSKINLHIKKPNTFDFNSHIYFIVPLPGYFTYVYIV